MDSIAMIVIIPYLVISGLMAIGLVIALFLKLLERILNWRLHKVTTKIEDGMAPKEKIVYKLKDLVDILGVSVRTLRKYIKRGELRAVKIGRNYLVRPQDLDDFLEANIFTPPKQNSTELLQELIEAIPPKLPDRPKLIAAQKIKSKKGLM